MLQNDRHQEKFLTDELKKLRDQYITATKRQRLNKAQQRLENPDAYPNVLVTRVAGIEAFARSLMMHSEAKTKDELRSIYPKYRNRKPATLIAEYCRLQGEKPADYFGSRTWRLFNVAVGYRNLLAHECTYLSHQKFSPLEDACSQILRKLARLAKLKIPAV